jgi:hypothetical protein
MSRRLMFLPVLVVVATGGCTSAPPIVPGADLSTVATCRPGKALEVNEALVYGTYSLYRGSPDAKDLGGPETPQLFGTCAIPFRDPVGFTTDADGRLCAVAGQLQFCIPEGVPYFWQAKAEPLPPLKPQFPEIEELLVGTKNALLIGAFGVFIVGVFAAYIMAGGHTM